MRSQPLWDFTKLKRSVNEEVREVWWWKISENKPLGDLFDSLSCNQVLACSLLNTIFHIEINKKYKEGFSLLVEVLWEKEIIASLLKNST